VPNERELHEHVTDLEILSGMRNLQPEIKKQIEKMPIIYDLRKDLRFQEGSEDRARNSAIRLLKQGVLTAAMIAEGLEISLAFVLDIQKELQEKPKLKSRSKQAS
jgi:hypothetical protein